MLSSGIHKRLIAVAGLIAGLLLAAAATPAFAHDELIGADPADGAVLDVLPPELTLTFSGVLLDGEGATELAVTDAGGADLTGGDPVLDGVRVTQPLTGTASGTVHVAWRVVSSDGHPISGEYTFSVGDVTAPSTPGPSLENDVVSVEVFPAWLAIGILAVIGVTVALVLSRRRPPRED